MKNYFLLLMALLLSCNATEAKWMTIENADPFIAAVAELESSVVSADNFGKIIIEIVVVVYGSLGICHTFHLHTEIITGFFIIITSIILFLLSIP